MNKIEVLLLFTVIFTITACTNERDFLQIEISEINQVQLDGDTTENGCYFSIKLEIISKADTTIRFWTMSCSWEDTWISSDSSVRLFNRGCDSNYPQIVQLNPGQSITYNGILYLSDTNESILIKEVKLGFRIINESEYSGDSDFYLLLTKNSVNNPKVIWSNGFNMVKCSKVDNRSRK